MFLCLSETRTSETLDKVEREKMMKLFKKRKKVKKIRIINDKNEFEFIGRVEAFINRNNVIDIQYSGQNRGWGNDWYSAIIIYEEEE